MELVDGEKCIVAPSQQRKICSDDMALFHHVKLIPGKSRPSFVHGITKEVFSSPTSLCVNVLSRTGKTNCWAGPRHVYVYRDGEWMNLKGLPAIMIE
jgi:hypothetical protein